MLLGFFLPFCVCGSTAKDLASSSPPNTTEATEKLILQAMAVPDYPVASGQKVQLSCRSAFSLNPVLWNWSHLQNNTWKKVIDGKELTLSKPEDSGLYRCYAETKFQKSVSQNLTVFIISVPRQTNEDLGEAALVLSILNLIFLIAAFLWFMSQKFCHQRTTSSTSKKVEATARPTAVPNVCKPPADPDGDVYMNYTGPNPAYTDLNPANMAGDNLYSSLS
uniref:Adhesion molecule with Ig-like domain 3 n=1 Tax=Nothobranchius rachovii TaxID=451742 RepID=A0A1A8RKV2_9TELE